MDLSLILLSNQEQRRQHFLRFRPVSTKKSIYRLEYLHQIKGFGLLTGAPGRWESKHPSLLDKRAYEQSSQQDNLCPIIDIDESVNFTDFWHRNSGGNRHTRKAKNFCIILYRQLLSAEYGEKKMTPIHHSR